MTIHGKAGSKHTLLEGKELEGSHKARNEAEMSKLFPHLSVNPTFRPGNYFVIDDDWERSDFGRLWTIQGHVWFLHYAYGKWIQHVFSSWVKATDQDAKAKSKGPEYTDYINQELLFIDIKRAISDRMWHELRRADKGYLGDYHYKKLWLFNVKSLEWEEI